MKKATVLMGMCFALSLCGTSNVDARGGQGRGQGNGQGQGGGQKRQEMLALYDTDGDGQLSSAEREIARSNMQSNGESQRQRNGQGNGEGQRQRNGQGNGEGQRQRNGQGNGEGQRQRNGEGNGQKNGEGNPERKAQMMQQFDTDGDGILSDSEKEIARANRQRNGEGNGQKNGEGNPERRAEMMQQFDTDGDGILSDSEKEIARANRQRNGNGRRNGQNPDSPTFENLQYSDIYDNDIELLNEYPSAPESFTGSNEERRAMMMEQFDTDGDGILSDSEKEIARANRQTNGQKQRNGQGNGQGQRNGQSNGMTRGGDNDQRQEQMLQRFDTDGDGQLSADERTAAQNAREALKNDPRLTDSRQSVQAAHQALMQAMQSGDSAAMAQAQSDLEIAKENHKAHAQEYRSLY